MDDLSKIRVLAVDDNREWCRLLAALLAQRSLRVIGTAGDGIEAVRKARDLQPDLIVMDLWMPALNGLEAAREIGTVAPQSRILIVSNERDPVIVDEAFAAGVRGYVLKTYVAAELLTAVEAIMRGQQFLGRGLTPGEVK